MMTHCYICLHIYFFFFLWVHYRGRIQNNSDIQLFLSCWTSWTVSSEIEWQRSPLLYRV